MTDHFNELSESEQERLAILIEECSEVIQAACKILRHGYTSYNPDLPGHPGNRIDLEKEVGDLTFAIQLLTGAGDVHPGNIHQRSLEKAKMIKQYLHCKENRTLCS